MQYPLAALVVEKSFSCNSNTSITLSVCENIATYTPHTNQNGQKIIFYYRIIINNVVLTHIFANHFAKVSQLLQKLLVALHYTLLLSHFLLFIFQFIPHSSLIRFAPAQFLINIATINNMNGFSHYSYSLTTPSLVLCVVSYTKKMHSIKQSTHFAHKILITIPYVQYIVHLYSLNLPFTNLNILLLYSDILLLTLKQFIIHKENPYSTQIPLQPKNYIIFLPQRAHYTNQYTRSLKIQWHSTRACLFNHHRFFAQKNQCSSHWLSLVYNQPLCSE